MIVLVILDIKKTFRENWRKWPKGRGSSGSRKQVCRGEGRSGVCWYYRGLLTGLMCVPVCVLHRLPLSHGLPSVFSCIVLVLKSNPKITVLFCHTTDQTGNKSLFKSWFKKEENGYVSGWLRMSLKHSEVHRMKSKQAFPVNSLEHRTRKNAKTLYC